MKKMILMFIVLLGLFIPAQGVFAAQVDPFNEVCEKNPTATACEEKKATINDTGTRDDDQNPLFGPEGIITKIINILSIVVGIVAVIGIMAAGLRFITSGSNPQQVTVAREMVLYAVVALLVAAFAQLLVRFALSKLYL